jgi:hypothetical protein
VLFTTFMLTIIWYPAVGGDAVPVRESVVRPGTNPVPVTVNCRVEPRVPDDGDIDVSVGGADWARAPVAVVRRTQNKSKLLKLKWLSRTRQPVLTRADANTQISFIAAHWAADVPTTDAVMKVCHSQPA